MTLALHTVAPASRPAVVRASTPALLQAPRSHDGFASVARASLLAIGLSFAMFANGQSSTHETAPKLREFPLLSFDEIGCRAKGRLQDKDYCRSKVMDQIIAQGKDAIPILISQITDTRPLKEEPFDFWGPITVGDMAYIILYDLFLDADWKTITMPGLKQIDMNCGASAEQCYHQLIERHGRKSIQDHWLAAWNANKDRVYWDAQSRCFRLAENTNRK
jgi:hypothetical protein